MDSLNLFTHILQGASEATLKDMGEIDWYINRALARHFENGSPKRIWDTLQT